MQSLLEDCKYITPEEARSAGVKRQNRINVRRTIGRPEVRLQGAWPACTAVVMTQGLRALQHCIVLHPCASICAADMSLRPYVSS